MTGKVAITIDDVFKSLIPPLREQELQLLEESIGSEGCREPLICWLKSDGERVLVDGHNRYSICEKLDLPYDIEDRQFAGRDEVEDWIDKNQLARRNLTPDQYSILRGRMYDREKKRHGNEGGDQDRTKALSGQSDHLKTAQRIAKKTGVSEKTVRRDHKKYLKLKQLEQTNPDEAEAVKTGKKRLREVERTLQAEVVKEAVAIPDAKYRVIYADPPWKYGDQLTESYGPTRFQYPPMSIAELCDLPVRDACEDNAVLFFWVTSPLLFEAAPVINAWGFKYKASFVWDKIKHNMGHYNSVRHEFLLVCTRGSCVPDNRKLFDSVQSIERTKKHSQKPEQFRQIIDELYPHGKRLEMFARQEADGWDAFSSQIGGAA